MPKSPTPEAPSRNAVEARYVEERDRRVQAGDRRYIDMAGDFSHLLADPQSKSDERAPLKDEVDALVVGGGFGGLLTAARLKEAGVRRVRIVEAGGDFGGTWYWNRYPGAACDIESYIYFPLLEETGYMPVERYSKAPEIRAHCRRIAEHYGLYELALFNTQVLSLDWEAQDGVWRVGTSRGDDMRARFVVLSTGPLNKPKLPAIPGVESFKGKAFHTSRWDYGYTGGGPAEPLTGLRDKRVAIIGTGATAIQCVPPLAACAQHLYVVQRTPSSVDARNNSATDPEWVKSLKPGWQQRRMENFTAQMAGHFAEEDMVGDGWTVLARAVRARLAQAPVDPDIAALVAEADMDKMVDVRARIDRIVEDPATAEALKPWFSLFCKRPCFHDDYLAAFNRPNVTLVDTAGRGVEAITETGLVANGRSYEVDCIIFATGFETSTELSRRAGFTLRGVNGASLGQKWAAGLSTLHGMHTHGFPNCFIMSQAQSGMSPNFPHMLSEQAKHVAHIVAFSLDKGFKQVEANAQAEAEWVEEIVSMSAPRIEQLEACTPGYYNNEGKVSPGVARSLPYGGGAVAFINLLKEWRDGGGYEGLEFDGAPRRVSEPA